MALAVIEGVVSQAQAALQLAVTAKVVKQWVERYKAEGRGRPLVAVRHSPKATD